MKKIVFTFVLLLSFQITSSQNMSPNRLGKILEKVSDTIQGNGKQWQFQIKGLDFLCVTDSTHNRMRIISPIIEFDKLSENLKDAILIANFHSALDVKYAVADGVLWSAYIHPLKELTETQVLDAVSQVYSAHKTFGTTFSSTSLIFPARKPEENQQPEKKPEPVIRKI